MQHYVYILECRNGTLYTGYTKNIIVRYKQHESGKGAKYTKYNPPIQLLYFEIFDDRKIAMRREREIKKLPRIKKIKLCQSMTPKNMDYLVNRN